MTQTNLNMHTDRAYLLIGGAGGIGSELARGLAGAGAQLTIAGRDAGKAKALSDELGVHALDSLNATDHEAVDRAVADAADHHGRLDGAVNLPGTIMLKPAHLTTPQELRDTIDTNLVTAFNLVRSASQAMRKEGGSIVLMSSAAATSGLPNHEAIAAAKAGVIGLARSAAATYAGNGVRVNAVAPGMVRTPLSEPILSNDMAEKASTAMHPLGRLGEPADIAGAIAWLLEAGQGWVSGTVLEVDGGLANLRGRVKV
ncbi:MAG: SDR family oxidoreductase [Phycisphaera sp.]|nr:MAG: SDR family oxidoreductase [Phycisphaera sp.]